MTELLIQIAKEVPAWGFAIWLVWYILKRTTEEKEWLKNERATELAAIKDKVNEIKPLLDEVKRGNDRQEAAVHELEKKIDDLTVLTNRIDSSNNRSNQNRP